MSLEEKKGLLYVKKDARIGCRYHVAIFPANVPRLFSVNPGRSDDGTVAYDHWFHWNGLPSLAAVINGDLRALKECDEHHMAIARRSVIFAVKSRLFNIDAQAAVDTRIQELIEDELSRYTI